MVVGIQVRVLCDVVLASSWVFASSLCQVGQRLSRWHYGRNRLGDEPREADDGATVVSEILPESEDVVGADDDYTKGKGGCHFGGQQCRTAV